MDTDDDRSAREHAWRALDPHWQRLSGRRVLDLFDAHRERPKVFSAEACGLFLDYSKQRLDEPALQALLGLVGASGLTRRRAAMYAGAVVNPTEQRAAWHVALRRPAGWVADSARAESAHEDVHRVLARMRRFSDEVRGGEHRGYRGEPIRDVVNIGIGGSDLGPAMVCRALSELGAGGPRAHFVSNLDSTQLNRVLDECDPGTTLFIVASKTFSTLETLSNASTARDWLLAAAGDRSAVARHFVALSSRQDRCEAFGIPAANMFEFRDWVGGRYSLWSAIGLSIACHLGMDVFEELLAGGHDMDRHFMQAPASENLPVLLAAIGLWNRNCASIPSHAVLCYDFSLELFPAFLQQLEMESNGKRVDLRGNELTRPSAPVIWGSLGNNAQHAYFQLLHQGTDPVSCDFIVAAHLARPSPGHEAAVLANALGQAEVLMRGRSAECIRKELREEGLGADQLEPAVAHRQMPGDRPSSFLLYQRLSPRLLGALIALYEHKVFVQSVCWNVNAFDQFGVELGKRIAASIQAVLDGSGDERGHDPSTRALVERISRMRDAE